MAPTGPPPQALLDQKWQWQVLLVLQGLTFVLALIGLDIAGALLSGLMLCFAVIMTRDGMQELPRYAMVYGVLCFLNFFFDILPLVTELGGRVSRSTEPVKSTNDGQGVKQTTYITTTKTTPFFDSSMGFVYNVQSAAMILSPIAMALGVYLSISAHTEIQQHSPFFEDDFGDFRPQAAVVMAAAVGAGAAPPARANSGSVGASSSRAGAPPRNSVEYFQGQGYKL